MITISSDRIKWYPLGFMIGLTASMMFSADLYAYLPKELNLFFGAWTSACIMAKSFFAFILLIGLV